LRAEVGPPSHLASRLLPPEAIHDPLANPTADVKSFGKLPFDALCDKGIAHGNQVNPSPLRHPRQVADAASDLLVGVEELAQAGNRITITVVGLADGFVESP